MGNVQLIKQQVAELSRDKEEEEVGMDGRREKQVDISEEQEKKEGKMDREINKTEEWIREKMTRWRRTSKNTRVEKKRQEERRKK